MGYGLITIKNRDAELLNCGVVKMQPKTDHMERLARIFNRCIYLIDQFKPDVLSIEAPFYGKNVQSMLKLGRAQGMAMAAAISRSVPVFEYSPRKIKMAITGNGNASKEQVAGMVKAMLSLQSEPSFHDATDGLAVALCHHFQFKIEGENTGAKSWKAFLSANPDRLG